MKRASDRKPPDAFVHTSNVDGPDQEPARDDEHVVEIDGSIRFPQCLEPRTRSLRPASGFEPQIDHGNCRFRRSSC